MHLLDTWQTQGTIQTPRPQHFVAIYLVFVNKWNLKQQEVRLIVNLVINLYLLYNK
jgi:hypothetical protein